MDIRFLYLDRVYSYLHRSCVRLSSRLRVKLEGELQFELLYCFDHRGALGALYNESANVFIRISIFNKKI